MSIHVRSRLWVGCVMVGLTLGVPWAMGLEEAGVSLAQSEQVVEVTIKDYKFVTKQGTLRLGVPTVIKVGMNAERPDFGSTMFEGLHTRIERDGVIVYGRGLGGVFLDSKRDAVRGTDPLKPESAQSYFEGLQLMGIPSLTLAHMTKVEDARYPFGSVLWHTIARLTWSLVPKGDETILTNRKANNYAKQPAQSVELVWHNDVLRSVSERKASETLMERIVELLDEGPMSAGAIATSLGAESNAIRSLLPRELRSPSSHVTKQGHDWSLRS